MSNPADCQEYTELLSAYIDAELNAAEKAAVEQHLASCHTCSKQVKELRLVSSALQGMKLVETAKEIDFSFLDGPAPGASPAAASPEMSKSLPNLGIGMSQCAPIIELLDAYHDGELSVDERVLVDTHIKDCKPCVERLSEIKVLLERIKSLPKLEVPRDIVGSLNFETSPQRMSSKTPISATTVVPFQRKTKVAICTAAAAAVALIFAFNFKQTGQEEIASNGPKNAPVEILNQNQSQNQEKIASDSKREILQERKANEKDELIARDLSQAPKPSIEKEQSKPASKPTIVAEQRVTPAQGQVDDSANTIALMPDSFGSDGADALGIGTDEDGLYDIKI